MNSGAVDSLNVSARWGLSRNAFQIRPTVDSLSPECLAMDARDQWVASFGVFSRVSARTCSTCSSVIFRGAPGRGCGVRAAPRVVDESGPPFPPGGAGNLQPPGHLGVVLAGGALQDNSR